MDPIFEGGRKGRRARAWDVEDELIAVALLGDVTIDLSDVKSAPAEIEIEAYALVRDVDVIVSADTRVEMFGRALLGDLQNEVAIVPQEQHDRVVRIHGHAFLGDVTVRTSDSA